MSDSKVTNVDLHVVRQVIAQLGALSTSVEQVSNLLGDGSDLSWTGADETGTTLHEQLVPAEGGGIQAVADAKQAVDGLIDSLGRTAGLWKNTEGTNIDMNL
jgi:hypothetical protein